MPQILFLDTNVILDYLENRNEEVKDIVAQLLLFHKKGEIVLATSVFNIAELIDKEFQIQHIGSLLSEKLSYDEIMNEKSKKKKFRENARQYKEEIQKKIRRFIEREGIDILELGTSPWNEGNQEISGYDELYNLIFSHQFSSQDALIIGAALCNGITYFISNDSDIVHEINENNLVDAYSLRDRKQREDFQNNVLLTLIGKSK